MANSKYASTRETTNLARVARIILGPCTDVLSAVLTKEISPPTLSQKVKTYLAKLSKRKQPPITQEQERIIHKGNYSDFDITLLYFLLRNISNIPPHANQWGNDPSPSDRSVSANIERIRLIRNKYGHCPELSISDTDFHQKIQEISGIIQDLEKYLGTSIVYQDAVVEIKTCCMDPEQNSGYINELLNLDKKIQDLSEKTKRIENSCVPKSVKVLYERDIFKWKEEDDIFAETHNFPVMLDQVRKQSYVTFVGVPGSGKTATVRHIALILQKEGYDILPIKDKNKIEDYCNSFTPQVFVIDDVLGVFGLNAFELDMINKYSERLTNPINPKTKILMTCREAVFRNERLSDCSLVKNENVVFLHGKENALTDEDKRNLLEKFNLDRDILTADNLASSSNMFPFLCKLFSSKKELQFYGPSFFISPVFCIIKAMNSLRTENKIQYAALVLLMANKNKLSEKILDNEDEEIIDNRKEGDLFEKMKCSILKKCKVSVTTDSFKLIDALTEMEGTYTKTSVSGFTFIHDSLFEIIAYHFGSMYPELILKYASSEYIANYIKIDQNNSQNRENESECKGNKFSENDHKNDAIIDLCIQLHESQYHVLAERLFKDVQDGELYNVFGNEALKSQSVLQDFTAVLEKHSYYNIYSLFLTESENAKICTWNYEPKNDRDENMKRYSLRFDTHVCLINERVIQKRIRSVRGIAWIILFGHHHILEYILSQIIKEKGNVDDLFVNSFNKHFQLSIMNQHITEDVSSFNHSKIGETLKINDFDEGYKTDIDKNRNTVAGADNDTNADTHVDTSVDTYCEPVIIEQCRLLCLGCYSGDLNTVQILLKHINADTLNYKFGYTGFFWGKIPLLIACRCGFEDIAMELIEAGADINISHRCSTLLQIVCEDSLAKKLLKFGAVNEYTPLQCACEEEFETLVEKLIKAKADVNLNVPLINACIKGNLCIVKQLIKAGADINRSKYGVSPLLAACSNGHFNVVKKLITVGADVNVNMKDEADRAIQMECLFKTDGLIPQGMKIMMEELTPPIAACDYGYFRILKLLIKSGANVDPNNNEKTTHNFPSYWDHLNIVKRLIQMESNVSHNSNEISFITACDCGQLELVKQMIKDGADVDMKDGDKTPLIVACFKEHVLVVKELIKAGADVNLGNEFISPLQVACYEGHLSIVKELKIAEFDGNQTTTVYKGLIGACFFGHFSIVKELITCHVEVNLKYGKETPLTTASFMGHLNIIKELIKAGADINLNNGGSTPLALACYRGHINIVRELIQNGADVNQSDEKETSLTTACERGHNDVVEELIKAGADVNQSDGNKTPLTAACEGGHDDVVIQLIKAGADVNQSDGNKTPLTAACERGHNDVVMQLIKAGANVNQSDGNKTPLTAAFERSHDVVARELIKAGAGLNQSGEIKKLLTAACKKGLWFDIDLLVEAGADVNQIDGKETPLTTACKEGNTMVVESLIKAGADVNQSNGKETPLTAACERGGHLLVVEELIKAGADVNQSDVNSTPLITACKQGNWLVITRLIGAGAKVNQSNRNKTPLTAACEQEDWLAIVFLIDAGADVNQSDGKETPLIVACENGNATVVKHLIKAGADVNQVVRYKTPHSVAYEKNHWIVLEELNKAFIDAIKSKRSQTIIYQRKS